VSSSEDTSSLEEMFAPARDDSTLLALERQFDAMSADLLAIQKELAGCSASQSCGQRTGEALARDNEETRAKCVEAILAQLAPIERTIMQMPACTIVGLAVKARHAAHVMSEYWDAPIDRIDWDAQVVRLLIEAVCDFAHQPLPLSKISGDSTR
jgi:hypothetical protein